MAEFVEAFAHPGEKPPLYFRRDKSGHEEDVVNDTGTALLPIGMKAGKTLNRSLFSGPEYFLGLGPPVATTGVPVRRRSALAAGAVGVRPWHGCVQERNCRA